MEAESSTAPAPEQAPGPDPESGLSAPEEVKRGLLAAARASGFERWALLLAWVIVLAAFSIIKPSTYFTGGNFQTIFGSQAVLLVVSLGLVLPLTTGDFDLSIASNLSLSSMVCAVLCVNHHWALIPAILVSVALSTFVGFLNGGLVVLIGIDSFIVTLGIGTVALGIVQWISNSNDITGTPQSLTNWTIGNRVAGISVMFIYGIVAAILLFYIFEFTPLGRRLLFVGRGRSVARLSGLRVNRIRWGSFVFCGLFAGIAGVMYTGSLAGSDPASGQNFLLPAFAACYLGGTAIFPGRFNPLGTFAAVYFLVSGVTGLQLLGVQNFVQQLFYGGALVIAVAFSRYAQRRAALKTTA